MGQQACQDFFDMGVAFEGNSSRIKTFEATVIRYMKENVALLSVYMREPYCVKIMQDVKYTR